MRKLLLLPTSLALVAATAALAWAQSPTTRFKSETRTETLTAIPRVDVKLNGATISQLQQKEGPRTTGALLPSLPVAIARATTELPQMQRAADSGLPILIQVSAANSLQRAPLAAGPASLAFLQELRAPLEVRQPEQEFQIEKITTDDSGQTHPCAPATNLAGPARVRR